MSQVAQTKKKTGWLAKIALGLLAVLLLLIAVMLWLTVASAQECTKDGLCDTHERCPIWANQDGEW